MSKIRKDVGVKIIFDDEDYSPEECSYLWAKLFHTLSKIAKKEITQDLLQKVFHPEMFKKEK